MKRKGKIHIGTSGWHYAHWVGRFYPDDIKEENQLDYYQQHFDTVEINNSFYHLPLAKTFTHWHERVNSEFVFAVKGSRYITHMKKLNIDKASIRTFLTRVKKLNGNTGPILFQLPPKWNVNTERLASFLEILPASYRYTIEFRNETWLTDAVYELLKSYNIAFCIYELAGYSTPMIVTADFVYIRLHGPGDKYQGNYSKATLKGWQKKILTWASEGLDVYCYFDNDQAAYAAANAKQLKELITG